MKDVEKKILHGGVLAAGVSGIAYACFKYLMRTDDPFSAVNHPLQPWALHAHVLAAPVLVFAVGIIFKEHVLAGLKNGAPVRARRVGAIALVTFAVLVVSGGLVQVLTGESLRKWTGLIHLGVGILFLLSYLVHAVGARRRSSTAGAALRDSEEGVPGDVRHAALTRLTIVQAHRKR
jgi:hypothetical protein